MRRKYEGFLCLSFALSLTARTVVDETISIIPVVALMFYEDTYAPSSLVQSVESQFVWENRTLFPSSPSRRLLPVATSPLLGVLTSSARVFLFVPTLFEGRGNTEGPCERKESL